MLLPSSPLSSTLAQTTDMNRPLWVFLVTIWVKSFHYTKSYFFILVRLSPPSQHLNSLDGHETTTFKFISLATKKDTPNLNLQNKSKFVFGQRISFKSRKLLSFWTKGVLQAVVFLESNHYKLRRKQLKVLHQLRSRCDCDNLKTTLWFGQEIGTLGIKRESERNDSLLYRYYQRECILYTILKQTTPNITHL